MTPFLRSSVSIITLAAVLTGCGKSEPQATASSTDAAATAGTTTVAPPPVAPTPTADPTSTTAAGGAAAPAAARLIEVQGNDAMKFSVTRIEAKPGEQLQIKLVNVGTLPKEAMGHNLVLLKKSANPQAFANAALTAKATDYIPPSMKGDVIAATKLLGPKQSDTITFTVPAEAGEYPYLCSFPAHFVAGMKGVLVVR